MFLKKEKSILVSKKTFKQFIRFGIVGTSALIFETCLIFILFEIGITPKYSRIITIPLAILLTWYFNRNFTFNNKNPKKFRQYIKYFFVIMFGILINYSVYLYFLDLLKAIQFSYVIALCLGSLSSMVFNFWISKFYTFKN